MTKYPWLIFLLLINLNASAATPPKMLCTEQSFVGNDYKYPANNVELLFKNALTEGGYSFQLYHVSFHDNENRSFDVTNDYYARSVAYWVNYESNKNDQYFHEQCGSHINDGRAYHFLIAGGDFGPMMCLSCSAENSADVQF